MNPVRRIAGYLCMLLGFALIASIGAGVVTPPGMPAGAPASLGALLAGLLPSVLATLALFLLGLWLARGGRK